MYSITVSGSKFKLRKTDFVEAMEKAMNESYTLFTCCVFAVTATIDRLTLHLVSRTTSANEASCFCVMHDATSIVLSKADTVHRVFLAGLINEYDVLFEGILSPPITR